MGLDKWIKTDEKKESKKKSGESKKKKPDTKDARSKTMSENIVQKKKVELSTQSITKYHLKCSKKGCNYQKTIVKKQLNKRDTICPRCKSTMKTK